MGLMLSANKQPLYIERTLETKSSFDDIDNVNRSQLSFAELLWAMRI